MDKRTVINYLYSLLYQILSMVVPLITTPYVARRLGAENLGVYSYTTSIASYFAIFITFGFHAYGQREIASYQENIEKRSDIFFEIQLKKLFLTIFAMFAYILFIEIDGRYTDIFFVNIISLVSVFFDISYLFQGLELYKVTVIRNCIVKLAGVGLIFAFVRDENDLYIYTLIQCGIILFGNFPLWLYLKKYIDYRCFKHVEILKNNKEIFELFVPVISVQLYFTVDRTMLGTMNQNISETGYYDQALKIIRICQTIITSLGAVLTSSVSRTLASGNERKVNEMIRNSICFGIMLACPMMFGIFSVSSYFVPWFFGDGYLRVSQIMAALAPLLLFSAISNIATNGLLIPMHKQNYVSIATAIAAVVNILLNYFLIPQYMAVGAAMASVVSEAVVMIVSVFFSRNFFDYKQLMVGIYKYVIAAVCMFAVINIVNKGIQCNNFVHTVLSITLGGVVYFCALIWMKDTQMETFASKISKKCK